MPVPVPPRRRRTRALVAAAVVLGALATPAAVASQPPPTPLRAAHWPTYAHDSRHTFSTTTTLDKVSVRTLAPRWYFRTGDAVTATPTVVAGVVYVGSWDGRFYALDAKTGARRWAFTLKPQPAVTPVPGRARDITSDGGLVTSSAWFEPGSASRPDLVIFGGGFTLYALVARTGAPYWSHDYPGLPEQPANPGKDESRIFSSPVVVGNRVLFAVTADGQRGHRGYAAAADLSTGKPLWRFETDVDAKTGKVLNNGCGGVWSSPTVISRLGLIVLDVSDCHFDNPPPFHERVFALRVADGRLAWVFDPPRADPGCDWDFGATANLGVDTKGNPTFLGVGGKDGTYYSLDPRTGRLRWSRNVVFGGFAGGFIPTTAYDGHRVYGATALGDFGRFEGVGELFCAPNPRDLPVQEPSMHAVDAATGNVAWQGVLNQSFAPTTVAGGMTFNGTALTREIVVRDADTGAILNVLPLLAPNDSGIAIVNNALYFGTGSSEQGSPTGVYCYAPA